MQLYRYRTAECRQTNNSTGEDKFCCLKSLGPCSSLLPSNPPSGRGCIIHAMAELSSTNSTGSIEVQHQQPLVSHMRARLMDLPPPSTSCSIYRVPKKLRNVNVQAYVPHVVSIGPYHHGLQDLEAMEKLKWRYLQMFLLWTATSLEDLVDYMKQNEARARTYYADEISFDSDKFVEILIVDSTFIIVHLLSYHFHLYDSSLAERGYWSVYSVPHDLGLLENQLPFFILTDLLNVARSAKQLPCLIEDSTTIVHLVCRFFSDYMLSKVFPDCVQSSKLRHIVDLLRICHLPSGRRLHPKQPGKNEVPLSLTSLHEAGVKLKVSSSSKKWTDLKFTKNNGILEIPYMVVQDTAESMLRNIVAYEQCHFLEDKYITDYVVTMDKLVNSPKDVEVLIQNGILENHTGRRNEQVSNLFNSLNKDIYYDTETFYYSQLSQDLNAYCRSTWHRWIATLRHEYLKNPWTIISVVAAVVLLLLTLVQTICSIISLKQ